MIHGTCASDQYVFSLAIKMADRSSPAIPAMVSADHSDPRAKWCEGIRHDSFRGAEFQTFARTASPNWRRNSLGDDDAPLLHRQCRIRFVEGVLDGSPTRTVDPALIYSLGCEFERHESIAG